MTPEILRRAMPYAGMRAGLFAGPLTAAMQRWEISTPQRQAAFLANIAAETASLSMLKENSDGAAYEGRHDLGNTEPGDGKVFIGRGLLQITGRANYALAGEKLGLPLIANPALLEQPETACEAAGWFWSYRGCSRLADADPNHFGSICHLINGGYDGIDERIGCWLTARAALGLRA